MLSCITLLPNKTHLHHFFDVLMPALVQQFLLAADRLLGPYTVKATVNLALY